MRWLPYHPWYLSHTWVRYPRFSSHGVKCPILTTVVPGFSGDLIGCTIQSKWGPFGDLYLARKNLLFVWNKLFLGEIKFSQRRTSPVKYLWWQIVPMQGSTNEWKHLTIFLNNGTCGNTMVKLGPRWRQKSLDLRSRDFLPPPWTSWWVNCAIPTAHVVSL